VGSLWLLPPAGRGGFAGDLLALLFGKGAGTGFAANLSGVASDRLASRIKKDLGLK